MVSLTATTALTIHRVGRRNEIVGGQAVGGVGVVSDRVEDGGRDEGLLTGLLQVLLLRIRSLGKGRHG